MGAQLRLIDDHSNIVHLPIREPCTFDQAWSIRAGQMKTRGDGRDKTRTLWSKAAKKVGSTQLLGALRRYLGQKEPTCGFCGLSVWLNGQKYDHWLDAQTDAEGNPCAERTSAPEPVRARALASLGEPFVRSYLDPCTFHEDGYITPRTSFAKDKLREKAAVLKAAGVLGLRNK